MAEGAAEAVIDAQRLKMEYEEYQNWLEGRIEEAYVVASQAKAKGLDFKEIVEIPRAPDLDPLDLDGDTGPQAASLSCLLDQQPWVSPLSP